MSHVCKCYKWADHGTWCSWYAWTCQFGPPRNLDTTDCTKTGSCGDIAGSGIGCIDDSIQLPPAPAPVAKTPSGDFLRLRTKFEKKLKKNGYGKKQVGPNHPRKTKGTIGPPEAGVVVNGNVEKHIRIAYTTNAGENITHAHCFLRYVSHTQHPDAQNGFYKGYPGIFAIAYEIDDPGTAPDFDFGADQVTMLDDYCVSVDLVGIGDVDVLLHCDSPKAK